MEEAVYGHADILQVWYTAKISESERKKHLIREFKKRSIPHGETTLENLDRISETVHHQGIIALIRLPIDLKIETGKQQNWLYLEKIRDPGNLGTILRTADWFGVKHVALSKQCADVYNPKVVRSGMGAHFHLNIYPGVNLNKIKEMGHTVIAADYGGKPIVTNFDSLQHELHATKWCLVLGSEAFGITEESRPLIDLCIAIPGSGSAESLNVAVAGGIILFYLLKN